MSSRSAHGNDEEVVELDMPRPRSISRRPEDRRQAQSSRAIVADTQSPKPDIRRQSIAADQEALANITNDLKAQNQESKQDYQASVLDQSESATMASEDHKDPEVLSDDEAIDQDFRARFAAVQAADIEEVMKSIRSDPEYSIMQEGPARPGISSAFVPDLPPDQAVARADTPAASGQEPVATNNPTQDQQYTFHQGSRGQSPPPGFEDSSIPPYQDSTDVPSYQNVVSHPPGLAASSPAHTERSSGIMPESQRPAMTDKFMLAHQARHGSSALSPMALLTPDQTDMLPEYVLSGTAFDDSDLLRGRTRSSRHALFGETNEPERAKLDAELAAVRELEEREALEAIGTMESMRLSSPQQFSVDQLAAMLDAGDNPSDYYSPEELQEFQRLASDSASEQENMEATAQEDSDLLKLMSQFVRQSPETDQTEAQASTGQEESEELESMLRDRMLTRNPPAKDRGTFARHQDSTENSSHFDPVVLTILADAAQVSDTGNAIQSGSQVTNMFADSRARTGVDVEALKDAALARKELDSPAEHSAARPDQVQNMPGYGSGHGIKRTTVDPATYASQQLKNEKKAHAYAELCADVNARRSQQDISQESFDLTTKLLMLNPEYYSIWNYRREIMLHGLFPHLDDIQKQDLLNTELKRLQGIQQDYPKVYWIWTHRKWCLASCPWPDWSRELLLVTKMLEQDARNFHVWEYRRYVIDQIEKADDSSKAAREFEYTTAAINSNFSNFSAWHNRTKLIPQILLQIEDHQARDAKRKELLKDELNLIKGAIYTDPDDQSVWLYHRWLINPESASPSSHPLAPVTEDEHVYHLNQELLMIEELLEEEPDNVWCAYAKVHYTLNLQRLTNDSGSATTSEELQSLIAALGKNDHLREGRYRDWHNATIAPAADSGIDIEFVLFNDLRKKSEWSDITLHQDGQILGTYKSSSAVVVSSWAQVAKARSTVQGRRIIVGQIDQSGRIEYLEVLPLA